LNYGVSNRALNNDGIDSYSRVLKRKLLDFCSIENNQNKDTLEYKLYDGELASIIPHEEFKQIYLRDTIIDIPSTWSRIDFLSETKSVIFTTITTFIKNNKVIPLFNKTIIINEQASIQCSYL